MYKKLIFLLFVISTFLFFVQLSQAMSMCGPDLMGRSGGMDNRGMAQQIDVSRQPQQPVRNTDEWFFTGMKDELNLSESQIKGIEGIRREYENEKARKGLTIGSIEGELAALQAKRNPDIGEIKTKLDEVENLRKETRLDYIRSVEQAKKLMTDEQIDMLSKNGKNSSVPVEGEMERGSMSRDNTTRGHDGMGSHGGMTGGY